MDNLTGQDFETNASIDKVVTEMLGAEVAAIIAAVAAAIGSIIYASKHIKHSECCGARCDQAVTVEVPMPPTPSGIARLETNV